MGTLGGLSDGGLLERFAAHREEATFEALVWRHGSMNRGRLLETSGIITTPRMPFRRLSSFWPGKVIQSPFGS